jgi:hypothetical protein
MRRIQLQSKKSKILSSTVEFGKFTGSNSHDTAQQRYPWIDFQRQIADYFDSPAPTIGVPIKPVAVPRTCLKTEIGCQALARFILKNPERRNLILGSIAERAEQNLSNVQGVLLNQDTQYLFPDVLYNPSDPRDSYGRLMSSYTKDALLVKRLGNYREQTVEAMGRNARLAGKHFDGVIWIDDIVSEQDDFENNPQISETIIHLLHHIIEFVATPGCEIWLTFTRYHDADPYARIVEENGPFAGSIAPGMMILDCYRRDDAGEITDSIYPFRYCIEKADEVKDVHWAGHTYPAVRRRSIKEMEARMPPKVFYSQMLNRPLSGAAIGFAPSWFEKELPCTGVNFRDWLGMQKPDNEWKLNPDHSLDLRVVILGDPSFGNRRVNDFAVLWVVAQTPDNKWIVLDGFSGKLGYKGDLRYAKTALDFKQAYHANELAIETYSCRSLRTTFDTVAQQEGLGNVHLMDLPKNANCHKKDRIATLIPLFSEGRIYFCSNARALRDTVKREAEKFPGCCDGIHGLHDDHLDALANGTQVFKRRMSFKENQDGDFAPWVNRLPNRVRRMFRGRTR